MSRTVDLPYGAFELKKYYRRNMILGTGFSAGVSLLMILALWLIGIFNSEDIIEEKVIVIKTIADIGPPPAIELKRPQVPISNPGVAVPRVGIPVPVDENEIYEEEWNLPSRQQLKEINTPSFNDEGTGPGTEIIIDIPIDEIIPPDTFRAVEIFPELVYEELPKYPTIAQAAGFTGWVWIKVYIDKSGNVKKAEAVRCNRPNMGFEDEALKAAYQCKYRPAIQNGDPVGVWIAYRVEFKF